MTFWANWSWKDAAPLSIVSPAPQTMTVKAEVAETQLLRVYLATSRRTTTSVTDPLGCSIECTFILLFVGIRPWSDSGSASCWRCGVAGCQNVGATSKD